MTTSSVTLQYAKFTLTSESAAACASDAIEWRESRAGGQPPRLSCLTVRVCANVAVSAAVARAGLERESDVRQSCESVVMELRKLYLRRRRKRVETAPSRYAVPTWVPGEPVAEIMRRRMSSGREDRVGSVGGGCFGDMTSFYCFVKVFLCG